MKLYMGLDYPPILPGEDSEETMNQQIDELVEQKKRENPSFNEAEAREFLGEFGPRLAKRPYKLRDRFKRELIHGARAEHALMLELDLPEEIAREFHSGFQPIGEGGENTFIIPSEKVVEFLREGRGRFHDMNQFREERDREFDKRRQR